MRRPQMKGKTVDFSSLPGHIAIIMDGNRRWAKKRFLPKSAGHKAGADALRTLAEKMNAAGFKNLTVFAFSTENWARPADEVEELMRLLRGYIKQYIEDSKKNNMRIGVLGNVSRLDTDLADSIKYLTELTCENAGLKVNIAINYSGRDEIVRAAKMLCADALDGKITVDGINNETFATYLNTRDLRDPDLIIRTSGESRISNFLLWQSAYSEFFVSGKLWPDFTYDDLLSAVSDYQGRSRRFGG